jgi:hypothetical protein
MITATFLAIFFIPLFFVGVVQLFEKRKFGRRDGPGPDAKTPSEGR